MTCNIHLLGESCQADPGRQTLPIWRPIPLLARSLLRPLDHCPNSLMWLGLKRRLSSTSKALVELSNRTLNTKIDLSIRVVFLAGMNCRNSGAQVLEMIGKL